MKIVIADDDASSRFLLTQATLHWGYDVIAVASGHEALATLTGEHSPRLAILDWEMPAPSGVQICRIIRAREQGPYVYVLLLTGRVDKKYVIQGLAAGADDYVSKPYDVQELEVRLRAGRRIVELQDQLLDAQRRLETRATYDMLTGIRNRAATLDFLDNALKVAARDRQHLSLFLLDVDHFKYINDTHGHRIGDDVLRELCRRAQQPVRCTDIVGRYGGEEFLFILPQCRFQKGLESAERVRSHLAATPIPTSAGPLPITASLGVAATDLGYWCPDALIQAADEALYVAKQTGRNRVRGAARQP